MPCGSCGHKSRFHEAWPPCLVEKCQCQGWQAASNKAADYKCAACKKNRGYEWLSGRVVCWPCWRDHERDGKSEIVAKPGPLVVKR